VAMVAAAVAAAVAEKLALTAMEAGASLAAAETVTADETGAPVVAVATATKYGGGQWQTTTEMTGADNEDCGCGGGDPDGVVAVFECWRLATRRGAPVKEFTKHKGTVGHGGLWTRLRKRIVVLCGALENDLAGGSMILAPFLVFAIYALCPMPYSHATNAGFPTSHRLRWL